MQSVLAFWQSIPAEHRGWVEFWAFSAALAAIRWSVRRWVPSANVPGWLHAIDLAAHVATASSKSLADKSAKAAHGGIPDVLLPRVPFPDERTPPARPSKLP